MRAIYGCVAVMMIALICAFAPQKQSGYVIDNDNVFTDSQVVSLNKLFKAHQRKTTNQIAVYTTSNYGTDTSIHAFGTRMGKELGVGQVGKNNGVIITLCLPRREVDISTGKGTERVLKNEMCKQIIDDAMTPDFKKGNYFSGMYEGSKAIIEILERQGNEIK